MKKPVAIQISIPQPCTQAWNEMQPVPNGRHCAHCEKTVTDFTRMTDTALLDYVQRNGLGCGQFREEQLDRLVEAAAMPRKKWWPQVMLSLGLLLGIQKEGYGQRPATEIVASANAKNALSPNETSISGDTISVSGEVKDQNDPIINAAILVIDSSGSVLGEALTDYDGLFTITLANGDYIGKTMSIRTVYLNRELIIQLKLVEGRNSIKIKIPYDQTKNVHRVRKGGYGVQLVAFQPIDTKHPNPVQDLTIYNAHAPSLKQSRSLEIHKNPIVESPVLPSEKSFWRRLQFWRK